MKEQTNNNKEMTVQTVQIGKQQASFLVPDYNDGQKLAVIDEGVLKYLRRLLPKASIADIIQDFINEQTMAQRHNSLDDSVKSAKEYIAFQTSINLLKKYFDPNAKVIMQEPFNVTRELTITEKSLRLNELREEVIRLDKEINDYNREHNGPQLVQVP